MKTYETAPEFRVKIDKDLCTRCKRCTMQCGFGTLSYDAEADKIVADNHKCVACHRCMVYCPNEAITIERNTHCLPELRRLARLPRERVYKQAATGGVLLTGMGNAAEYESIFDHLSSTPARSPTPRSTPCASRWNC